jgi:hypothetical protein
VDPKGIFNRFIGTLA